MDSLRYWVTEMHVDGFRFDLASTLAREFYDVDRLSTFFEVVQQDPVVGQVKLIAEPWDVGPGGYQVGNFPPNWTEWNGKYRDTVRDFWRGEPATLAEFAMRITGSADLYQDDGRKPFHSINFVTAHDGFTMSDLVSYNDKHNEANGEENRDGESHNRSWNCGAEGDTDDFTILALRARQQRNFIATLLLSQGVPMLCHGDELGRTQRGNNNVYCQDNELSWVDWQLDDAQHDLIAFTQRVVTLRRDHPVFRRRRVFTGEEHHGGISDVGEIAWFTPAGTPMEPQDWTNGYARAVAVFLNGEALFAPDKRGQHVLDDSFLVVFNAHHEPLEFTVPPAEYGHWWSVLVDTADDAGGSSDSGDTYAPGHQVTVAPRSLVILRRPLQPLGSTAATAAATSDPSTPSAARAVRPGQSLDHRPSSGALPTPTPARRRDDSSPPGPRRYGR
jgi:glycogen operon protein